jgi:hypothetical protein
LWLAPLLALVLGWRFNRSKPVFLILVLLLAERAVDYFSPMPGGDRDGVAVVVQVAALLLPLNFVLLGLGAERGLFGLHALLRLLLVVAQPILVTLVATSHPHLLAVLRAEFMPFALPWPGHLAPAGQLAFGLGLAFLLGRWLVTRGPWKTVSSGGCWLPGRGWPLAAAYGLPSCSGWPA